MEQENKLAKLLSDDLTEEELAELKANPDYELYEKIKRYSASLEIPDDTDDSVSLEDILASEKQMPKQRRLYQNRWLQTAAAVLLLLTASLLYLQSGSRTFHTAKGRQSHIYLPDASEATLNAGSKMSFNSHQWPLRRTLQLEGEAYFQVAKGKIFSVNTSMGTIQVLGTKFNVKSDNKSLEVICYEGRVEVSHLNKKTILTPGQSIFVREDNWVDGKVSLKQPVWTQNQLIFQSASLKEVLKELEITYGIRISITRLPASTKFTGTLPANNLETSLKIISDVFSMKYQKVAYGQYQLILL